jgi:hypothetical protein
MDLRPRGFVNFFASAISDGITMRSRRFQAQNGVLHEPAVGKPVAPKPVVDKFSQFCQVPGGFRITIDGKNTFLKFA